MEIDFTVYAQRQIPLIDEHSRRGQHAYRIVDEPTSLVVPKIVRWRLATIVGVRWLKIYDSVKTCGRITAYGIPPLKNDDCFVIKYGLESEAEWLTSSRLLILNRETAEVYYEGSAGDES